MEINTLAAWGFCAGTRQSPIRQAFDAQLHGSGLPYWNEVCSPMGHWTKRDL